MPGFSNADADRLNRSIEGVGDAFFQRKVLELEQQQRDRANERADRGEAFQREQFDFTKNRATAQDAETARHRGALEQQGDERNAISGWKAQKDVLAQQQTALKYANDRFSHDMEFNARGVKDGIFTPEKAKELALTAWQKMPPEMQDELTKINSWARQLQAGVLDFSKPEAPPTEEFPPSPNDRIVRTPTGQVHRIPATRENYGTRELVDELTGNKTRNKTRIPLSKEEADALRAKLAAAPEKPAATPQGPGWGDRLRELLAGPKVEQPAGGPLPTFDPQSPGMQGRSLTAPPAEAPPAIQEGQTATNPKTGKKLIFKGGKWQPLKTN